MPLQFMMILRQPCNRAGLLVDYGPMENSEFEQLKAWVEFAPRDAAYLRQLDPRMRPHLVSLDDAFANGQPQARTPRLRGIEWFQRVPQDLGGHAGAAVPKRR